MDIKRVRTSTLLFLFLGVAFIFNSAVSIYAQDVKLKKRIAVFIFEDKTDRSWRWWNN